MKKNFAKIFNKRVSFVYFLILEAILLFLDFKYFVNSERLSEFVLVMRPLIEVIYTSLVNFAAVWITCYLLVAQVFKDRYSLENAEEMQLTPMSGQLRNIIVSVIFGVLMMFLTDAFDIFDRCILSMCGYCVFTLFVIVGVLWSAKNTVKSMMTNTMVDKAFSNIHKEIQKNKALPFKSVKNVQDIFEESILKEDNSVAEHIIQKTEELFCEMLESNVFESDAYKQSAVKIAEFLGFEINAVKNAHSSAIIRKMFEQQGNIMERLLDREDKTIFFKNMRWYCSHLSKMQTENDDISREFLRNSYRPFEIIFDRIIDQKDDELLASVFGTVANGFQYGLKHCRDEENAIFYAHILRRIAMRYYETNQAFFPEPLKSDYMNLLRELILAGDVKEDTIQICIGTFLSLKEKLPDVAVEFYRNIFFGKRGADFHQIGNGGYTVLKTAFLHKLFDEADTTYIKDNLKVIMELRVDAIQDSIELKKDGSIPFVDTYRELIETSDTYTLMDLVRDFCFLAARCLVVGNKTLFLFLLQQYVSFYRESDKKDDLFVFYRRLSTSEALLNNKEMFFIFLTVIEGLLETEYEERLASLLGGIALRNCEGKKEIIATLYRVQRSCQNARDKESVVWMLEDVLFSCEEESVKSSAARALVEIAAREENEEQRQQIFVALTDEALTSVSSNVKKDIIDKIGIEKENRPPLSEEDLRRIYNICVSCIEKGDEETLKYGVSRLGWILLHALQNQDKEDAFKEYIIDRVTDIYEIAGKMDISHRTKVTMITLFTTIGMYCYVNGEEKYLKKIYRALESESIETVKLAMKLRLHENNSWDDVFVSDEAKQDAFIKGIEEQRKAEEI